MAQPCTVDIANTAYCGLTFTEYRQKLCAVVQLLAPSGQVSVAARGDIWLGAPTGEKVADAVMVTLGVWVGLEVTLEVADLVLVSEALEVAVLEPERVDVPVWLELGVPVLVGVPVLLDVRVGVPVCEEEGVPVRLAVWLGLGVPVAEAVAVLVREGVAVEVGVGIRSCRSASQQTPGRM